MKCAKSWWRIDSGFVDRHGASARLWATNQSDNSRCILGSPRKHNSFRSRTINWFPWENPPLRKSPLYRVGWSCLIVKSLGISRHWENPPCTGRAGNKGGFFQGNELMSQCDFWWPSRQWFMLNLPEDHFLLVIAKIQRQKNHCSLDEATSALDAENGRRLYPTILPLGVYNSRGSFLYDLRELFGRPPAI